MQNYMISGDIRQSNSRYKQSYY